MTYDYICENKKCKHEWEIEQKITEPVIKICPNCEQKTAKRLVSGGLGFQLKGGGWAKDSYK